MQAQPQQFIALVGGTLIDGTGNDPINDAVIIIQGSTIHHVGARNAIDIPADARIIDVAGKTVMPGMIECHAHLSTVTVDIKKRLHTYPTVKIFQTAQVMKRVLHAGFTTVRDAGGLDVGFRHAVEMGLVEGPRLVVAGPLRQTGGHFDKYYPFGVEISIWGLPRSDGVPAVQQSSREILRQGFDFIKVCTTGGIVSPTDHPEYTEWTMEELNAIVYEASARGKAVMAHAQGTQGIKNAIRAGIYSVEHGSMLDEEAVQMMLAKGTYLVPTLFAFQYLVDHGEEMGLSPVELSKIAVVSHHCATSFQMAARAGVKIATGSDIIDGTAHGRNAEELVLMVQCGFTPMQAIVAATRIAAEVCRVDDKVGILRAGKLADLLVVDGNPLDNIAILADSSRLLMVMKDGKPYVNKLMKSSTRKIKGHIE